MTYQWERPTLFVWMGLDTPEVREFALREDGIRRPSNEPMTVYLKLYYQVCQVCGRLEHTQSADPWHPEPGATVEVASKDVNEVVRQYRDQVRVLLVPPNAFDAGPGVCAACREAWVRAPEIMSVVRNMIRMVEYDREQRLRQAAEEGI
jgi:hypothetical protein